MKKVTIGVLFFMLSNCYTLRKMFECFGLVSNYIHTIHPSTVLAKDHGQCTKVTKRKGTHKFFPTRQAMFAPTHEKVVKKHRLQDGLSPRNCTTKEKDSSQWNTHTQRVCVCVCVREREREREWKEEVRWQGVEQGDREKE